MERPMATETHFYAPNNETVIASQRTRAAGISRVVYVRAPGHVVRATVAREYQIRFPRGSHFVHLSFLFLPQFVQ